MAANLYPDRAALDAETSAICHERRLLDRYQRLSTQRELQLKPIETGDGIRVGISNFR